MCNAQVSVSVILNKSECAVCIIYIHFNSSLECLMYSTATLLEFMETICRALAVSQAVCETLSRYQRSRLSWEVETVLTVRKEPEAQTGYETA